MSKSIFPRFAALPIIFIYLGINGCNKPQLTYQRFSHEIELFSKPPSSFGVGKALPLKFQVLDKKTRLPVKGASVYFSVKNGGGTISSSKVLSDSDGLATVEWTVGTKTDLNALVAYEELSDPRDESNSVPLEVMGLPGPIAKIEMSGLIPSQAGPRLFDLAVVVKDSYGNIVTNFDGTLMLTSSDPAAILPSPHTFRVEDKGEFIFFGIKLNTIGQQSVSVTNGQVSKTSPPVVVPAGAAAQILVSSGTPQSGTVATALNAPFVAVVRDINNAVVSGATVIWTVTGGGGSLSVGAATTDSNGLTSRTLTLGNVAGLNNNTVTASVSGVATPATFTASGLIGPHALSSTVSPSPTSITADGTTTSLITVTLKDAYNNFLSGKAVSVVSSRGATDTIATVSGTTNGSGQATFTVKSSTVGGPYFHGY